MLDKLKSLSKDTLVYGTSTIVSRFLNFLLVPLYTNIFIPADYGIITLVFSYIAILNVFFSIGLESGYFKFASTLEIGSKKENFSNPFIITAVNSFVLCFILYVFSDYISSAFLLNGSYAGVVKYSAGILFFDAVVLIPFAALRLAHKAKKFALIKIINISVNVGFNIVLIWFLKMGIEAVFISNLIASVITFIILLPDIKRDFEIGINKRLVKELFIFSLPIIPAGIGANLIQVIDRPILTYLTDEKTVGIYQANYKLGIFMMLFVSMFEFAWRPFLLNNAKEKNAKLIYSKVMTLFIAAGSLLFLLISLFISDIVKFNLPFKGHLIGSQYWGGLNIVPIILFAYLLYGVYINLTAGVYIEKKTKYLPLITGSAAALNIIVNFLLIPRLNITGASYATLASYLLMVIMLFVIIQKYYKINYEYGKIGKTILILALVYTLFLFFPEILWLKIVLPFLFAALIFALKVINLSALNIIKSPSKIS